MEQLRTRPTALFAGAFLLAPMATAAFGQRQPEAAEPPSVASKYLTAAPPGEYVGQDRCRSCHKPEFTEFGKTAHASISAPAKGYITGCEVCHGPGKVHSEAEEAAHGDDAKIAAANKLVFAFRANPSENAARCLTCHASSKDQQVFAHSEHARRGVSCSDCHATHLVEAAENPRRDTLGFAQAMFFTVPKLGEEIRWLHESLLKKRQPELCFTCHTTVQAQFALPTHHRVPEGLMKCTDCHDAHGTLNPRDLRKTKFEACVACHVEKRGPFLFEHKASLVEGCIACHSPHGSVNRQLLVAREGRFLCLSCHVDPMAVNVPHPRLSFATRGECVRCHVSIHGSNFEVNFMQ